ncbi:MAG: hypothetical protein J6C89_06010 [Clostridia bacterium]|nr:hypothetical protein [Clostridia bacterium]
MAVTNFIPTIWSKKILDDVELECKLVGHCWREYEGDATHAGSVKILGIGDVTIGNYEKKDIDIQEVGDNGQILTIDQAKYFAFVFDNVDKAQSVPGLMEGTRAEGVRGLAEARDAFVAGLIKSGTNITTVTALTEDAIKKGIDDALVALKERNCNEEMFIELTPAAAMLFLNSLTIKSTDNPEYIKKGVIGYYHGCKVIESNGLAKDGTHAYCAIRAKKAIAFVGQLEKVEAMPMERRFGDLVKGLDVYGGKIIDNKRLQVVKVPLKAS